MRQVALPLSLLCPALLAAWPTAPAQDPFGPKLPEFVSPEVSTEKKITFRVFAPKAEAVRLTGSDIPGMAKGAEMKKEKNGVWEATVGPVPPGAYRYNFNVD